MKRLSRSTSDCMIFGVAGGIAEFLRVDPTIIRLIWVVLLFMKVGIPLYLVFAIVIPKDTSVKFNWNNNSKWID